MGYVFLLISLFAGTLKGYCGKKTSNYTAGLGNAVFANTVRMLLCVLIGFVLILVTEDLRILIPSPRLLLIAALSGVSSAVFVVTWLICVKKSAYMMLDIFLMLGVLIPLCASSLFFSEPIKLTQWVGMGVLFVAVVIMCAYNNSVKSKMTLPGFILLLVCGVANGVADFSQKLFTKSIPNGSVAAFNFYTYVFAALVLSIAYAVTRTSAPDTEKGSLKRFFGYVFVMALCLFANSYFKTLAAGTLSAVLLYSLNQGCALILSAIMSAFLFKEKLTFKAVVGMLTAFAGLLIINLL